MNITDVIIRRTYSETRLLALVSITVDHDLAIHEIKIIQGDERIFVSMPSREEEPKADNPRRVFHDVCHPITAEARRQLEDTVLSAYYETIKKPTDEENKPDFEPDLSRVE